MANYLTYAAAWNPMFGAGETFFALGRESLTARLPRLCAPRTGSGVSSAATIYCKPH